MKIPSTRTLALIGAVVLVPAAAALANVGADTYRELDRFMSVFERVKGDYVVPVDDKQLIKGAIDGMLSSLDAESGYTAADSGTRSAAGPAGIGLTVTMEDGALRVVAPGSGSPAERAGLKPGDFISHIDGELAFGLSLAESVDKLRGVVGSAVSLTIARRGRTKPFDVTLTRALPGATTVGWRIEHGVGVIDVNGFAAGTAAELKGAIAAIERQSGGQPLGYVIDLRSTAGGDMNVAMQVADAFLDKGEIVERRGRETTDVVRSAAKKGDLAEGLPLVVLIDKGSAAAAEIVAGALQDNGRALVMGDQSYGLGSVQTVVPLNAGGSIRITTARYFTPSGRSVDEKGIEPDLEVPQLSDPDRPKADGGRFADLRRQIVREAKVDQDILESDADPDPRFKATPEELKKQGITDFQMSYALRTLERLGAPAGAAPAASRRR